MPAIATITANSPSRPKPPASHVVGKIHSSPSAEPGAASCISVIATMSIAGTTATHPNAMRFQGMTRVAPVTTNDDDHPGEEQHDVAGERADRDEHREHEHDRAEQKLIERRGAVSRAVDDVLAQPAGPRTRGARVVPRRVLLRRDGHTETVTDAARGSDASRASSASARRPGAQKPKSPPKSPNPPMSAPPASPPQPEPVSPHQRLSLRRRRPAMPARTRHPLEPSP